MTKTEKLRKETMGFGPERSPSLEKVDVFASVKRVANIIRRSDPLRNVDRSGSLVERDIGRVLEIVVTTVMAEISPSPAAPAGGPSPPPPPLEYDANTMRKKKPGVHLTFSVLMSFLLGFPLL
ncbi:hypothetical protein MLD38_032926 [Melastoma candidum]|uniref:Uncharacterized protein n=1 Tax=Melastoma candidum TaxID=119954 RepID=A0ACB9M5J1_9MYRT|nr:hypothetical protein MLD38_032926 [Melastoma candidum]